MLTHDAHPMLCAQCQVLGEKPGTSKARAMNDLEKVEKHIKDVIMPIRENLRKKRRNSGTGLTSPRSVSLPEPNSAIKLVELVKR
jgi:hypothetical protein